MTTIHEIEKAVSNLSPEKLKEFRTWFEKFDAEIWDKKFEHDAASGKLDALANEASEDYKKGNFRKL